MKSLCDDTAGSDSHLSVQNTKQDGWSYVRTLPSGHKLHLQRTTGKHTNAILAFLEWSKEHLPNFVNNRPLHMHMQQTEKLRVFNALVSMASDSSSHQMEMLCLSSRVVSLLQSHCFPDSETLRTLADLLLTGLSKVTGQLLEESSHGGRSCTSRQLHPIMS